MLGKTMGVIGFLAAALIANGAAAQEREMHLKLSQIIVDHVEFEEVTLPTVIKYIKQRSKELDPDKKGVNLFLLPPTNREKAPPTLTLVVDRVPLGELIRYVCRAVNYQYRVESYAVVIAPKDRALDRLETRIYPMDPEAVPEGVERLK